MAKYDALFTFLKNQNEDSLTLTYKNIENIISNKLPRSAYQYREFWGNGSDHPNVNAMLDAGYKVDNIDLVGEKIIIKKITK